MSRQTTSWRLILPYLAAWIPLAAALAALLRRSPGISWGDASLLAVPAAGLLAPICLVTRYPARGLPPERTPIGTLLLAHGAGAIVTTALWLGILRLWAEAVARVGPVTTLPNLMREQIVVLAAAGVLLYLLSVIFHSMVQAVERSRKSERRALELGLVARESELTLLRAQVDPHFLFNALNAIASLVGSDPGRARALCLRLGDFLRASLRIGKTKRILLADELALARDFLAIEQIRFGDRLRIVERIDDDCLECMVPPLILQPLVENAVRHGIAGLVAGGDVVIEARRAGSMLSLTVENAVDPDMPPRRGDGIGLANVRRRIFTLYEGSGGVTVSAPAGRFRVEIVIPPGIAPSERGDATHG